MRVNHSRSKANAGKPISSGQRLPWHTWVGLAVLLAGELGLLLGSPVVATWLTPIQWTGLILFLDGLVYRLRGRSWLMDRRREFPLLVLLSVGVWLVFEIYNLRLANWAYLGLPRDEWVRNLGYFWSFATIMPGVFEVSDLALAVLERTGLASSLRCSRLGPSWLWFVGGLALLTIPAALPPSAGAFLFGAVWIGFVPLFDPLNQKLGVPSVRGLLSDGYAQQVLALLLGGLICGFLWETWNHQAFRAGGAYWIYTFPEPLRIFGWSFGQMPVLGLLGFPPFALELFAFYHLLRELLGGERVFGRPTRAG